MNLEDLSKTQLVLLTLLVSFITSIATGIMAVALLTSQNQQSPITRTINNVIEHTIEKVVPSDTKTKEAPAVTSQDQITNAIAGASKSIVRIYTTLDPTASTTNISEKGVFHGIGVLVSSDGLFLVPDSLAIKGRTYTVETGNGIQTPATIVAEGRGDVALMKMTLATNTPTLSSATLGTPASLKLGQTVVGVGGESRTSVSVGTISSLVSGEGDSIKAIEAETAGVSTLGSVLISSSGLALGLYLPDSKTYAPISSDLVKSLQKPVTEKPQGTSSQAASGSTANTP